MTFTFDRHICVGVLFFLSLPPSFTSVCMVGVLVDLLVEVTMSTLNHLSSPFVLHCLNCMCECLLVASLQSLACSLMMCACIALESATLNTATRTLRAARLHCLVAVVQVTGALLLLHLSATNASIRSLGKLRSFLIYSPESVCLMVQ